MYPSFVWLVRRSLLLTLSVVNRRLEFTGLVVLLIQIMLAAPQFYVLASLSDNAEQQTTSALLCGATETLGAFAMARILTDPALLKTVGPSWTGANATSVTPGSPLPNKARSADAHGGTGDESDPARLLLIATKVVHHEIGEKVALFIGLGGAFFANSAARAGLAYLRTVCVLLLIETACDIVKDYAYSSRGVPTTQVRFAASPKALLALLCIGAASCATMFASVRVDCLAA